MKSYLSAFLLLLLLVDKSLSRIPPSLPKVIFRGEGVKYLWDNIKQAFSPPLPNQMQGLSRIKHYLFYYGYLQSSAPFDDYLDQETISATKTYRHYFNLPATGDLNNDTIHQISLLRCAVPDVNFNYDFPGDVSWPKARKRWFPKGKNLTYGFLLASKIPPNVTKVFRDAFTRWAQTTEVLNLTETTYNDTDIKVGFYNFSDGIEDKVLGGSFVRLQPASNVKTGEIRLDRNRFWLLPSDNDSLSWEDGVLDLESAAMHQIGHLLGLDHSNETDSVMYPYVLPSQQRKVQLSDSDKDNIQQHYTKAQLCPRCPFGGAFIYSLGFACMLLLY